MSRTLGRYETGESQNRELFILLFVSDPVLFEAVVQHWILAIDRDCTAVGLLFESPPVCIICKNPLKSYSHKIVCSTTAHSWIYRIAGNFRPTNISFIKFLDGFNFRTPCAVRKLNPYEI